MDNGNPYADVGSKAAAAAVATSSKVTHLAIGDQSGGDQPAPPLLQSALSLLEGSDVRNGPTATSGNVSFRPLLRVARASVGQPHNEYIT